MAVNTINLIPWLHAIPRLRPAISKAHSIMILILPIISERGPRVIFPTMAPMPIMVISLVDASYENAGSCTAYVLNNAGIYEEEPSPLDIGVAVYGNLGFDAILLHELNLSLHSFSCFLCLVALNLIYRDTWDQVGTFWFSQPCLIYKRVRMLRMKQYVPLINLVCNLDEV